MKTCALLAVATLLLAVLPLQTLGAFPGTTIAAGTNTVLTTNGNTITVNTVGDGAVMVGTVSNNVAVSGLLAVDATKTNGIAATLAHMTNALGLTGSTSTFLRSDGTQAAPGGGGSPGGSDTQVQFNDSSAFGGDAGLTYNKTTDALTVVGALASATLNTGQGAYELYAMDQDVLTTSTPQHLRLGLGAAADANHSILTALGTITTDKHALDITGTWNAAGVTFTGIKENITDTASASVSKLIDLQIGSSSKFNVDKTGNLTLAGTGNITTGGNIQSTGSYISATTSLSAGSGSAIFWSTRSLMYSTADGVIRFYNQAASGFTALYLGPDVATPSNVSLLAGSGSGTDKVGGNLTVAPGQSTGTARGGDFIVKTSDSATSTGSSANSYTTRKYVSAKPVALTESTATLVLNVTIASGNYAGIKVFATTYATDGTDKQATSDEFTVSAVNKAGTVTAGISTVAASSTIATDVAGTLVTTWTAVGNGNGVDIKCSAVSTLTQTVLTTKWQAELNSLDVATVTPQ